MGIGSNRNIGMMEEWNKGKTNSQFPTLQHSIVP
jgi:hypothetical protein